MPMIAAGKRVLARRLHDFRRQSARPVPEDAQRLERELLRRQLSGDGIHRPVHGGPGAVDVGLDLMRAVAAAVGARHWIFALSHCLFSWRLWVVCRGARLVFLRSARALVMRP